MKCEKCGFSNSEYDIICENCGAPLNIENNIELQKKYNNKQKAIDIERIVPDHSELMFDITKRNVSTIIKGFILLILFCIMCFTYYIYNDSKENNVLIQINESLASDKLSVIYIGNDSDTNKKLDSYVDTYNLDYKYFNSDKISRIKKRKIKSRLGIKSINNEVIILENNKVKDHISSAQDVEKFLIQNEVLPKEIGDAKKVIEEYDKSLLSEDALVMYVANNKNSSNDEHQKKLSEFCSKYEINYSFIEGYYLTNAQKIKLLNKINYSEIHDELLIIIDEGKVLSVNEIVPNSSNEYFDIISGYGIIDERSAKEFSNIGLKEFNTLIINKEKSVILIESKECNYCDKLKPIIGKLALQNNFKVYSVVVDETNKNSLEEKLKEIGFSEEKVVPPLVIVTEDNHLLDYIVGLSDKSIYVDKFTKLGIIR